MGLLVELVSSVHEEVDKWNKRRLNAINKAKVDLDLIVPLVEDYYDCRRPTEGKVVYSWRVGKGADEFRRFLDGFKVVVVQYPNSEIKVSRV